MTDNWAGYALSDFLMFSPASYFRRYELANADLWPAQLLLAVAAAALLWMVWHRQARTGPWIALLLAGAWILVAVGFLHRHYAQINLTADWFALAFVLQALLLFACSLREVCRQLVFEPLPPRARYPGMLLFVYSLLIHPLAGLLAGRSWRGVELFGIAPDATALATIGILLTGLHAGTWPLLLIPVAWCAVSALTYLAMGHVHGVATLALALTAVVATVVLRRGERVPRGGR